MRTITVSLFAAAASVGLAVAPAHADAVTSGNGVYLGLGASYEWFGVPKLNSIAAVIDTGPFLFISQPSTNMPDFTSGIAPKGYLGVNLGQLFPFGSAWRVEVGGTGFSQQNHNGNGYVQAPNAAGSFFDFLPISGGSVVGGSSIAAYTVTSAAKQTWGEGYASLAADFGFGSVRLTPSAGLAIGQLETAYTVNMLQAINGIPSVNETLGETVQTKYVGPSVALTVNVPIVSQVALTFSADAAWFLTSPHLGGTQTGFFNTSVSSTKGTSDMGRVGIHASTDYSPMPNLTLSLGGSASWWFNVPTVVNPQSSPGIVATTVTWPKAHIGWDDVASYGVDLKAIYHF